jgi:hypothetical protein
MWHPLNRCIFTFFCISKLQSVSLSNW